MEKRDIYCRIYKQLGLNFQINESLHLFIKQFDIGYFYNYLPLEKGPKCNNPSCHCATDDKMCKVTTHWYIVYRGTKKITFHNIYEILLWYYFYSIKRKYIDRSENYNKAYFSRIPRHYI